MAIALGQGMSWFAGIFTIFMRSGRFGYVRVRLGTSGAPKIHLSRAQSGSPDVGRVLLANTSHKGTHGSGFGTALLGLWSLV